MATIRHRDTNRSHQRFGVGDCDPALRLTAAGVGFVAKMEAKPPGKFADSSQLTRTSSSNAVKPTVDLRDKASWPGPVKRASEIEWPRLVIPVATH